MDVAILCSGPSLPKAWEMRPLVRYGAVIGVNAACDFIQCDWWSVGDWEALGWYSKAPRVGVCSQRDCLRHVREGAVALKCDLPSVQVAWEGLPIVPTYSSIAALGLAAVIGATRVTYFGDDKAGSVDFRGAFDDTDRKNDRWPKERKVLDAALPEIRRRGVQVLWARLVEGAQQTEPPSLTFRDCLA